MENSTTKYCGGCGETKPRSAFHAHSKRHDGLQSQCRDCINAYRSRRHAANPDIRRGYMLNQRYGLDHEAWSALFQSQGEACAICRTPSGGKSWHTDHCHKTGIVRGILCAKCNLKLSTLENADWCAAAHAYLLAARP